ncbi:hypothetical protein LguiB_035049 [Lonicera macranthoides]
MSEFSPPSRLPSSSSLAIPASTISFAEFLKELHHPFVLCCDGAYRLDSGKAAAATISLMQVPPSSFCSPAFLSFRRQPLSSKSSCVDPLLFLLFYGAKRSPVYRKLLKHRDYEVGLEPRLGKTQEETDHTQTYYNRIDNWLVGYEDKNGCVLESVKPFYDKVKETNRKRKIKEVSRSTIAKDELFEVFGKNLKGQVCGAGSHVTKKKLIHVGLV